MKPAFWVSESMAYGRSSESYWNDHEKGSSYRRRKMSPSWKIHQYRYAPVGNRRLRPNFLADWRTENRQLQIPPVPYASVCHLGMMKTGLVVLSSPGACLPNHEYGALDMKLSSILRSRSLSPSVRVDLDRQNIVCAQPTTSGCIGPNHGIRMDNPHVALLLSEQRPISYQIRRECLYSFILSRLTSRDSSHAVLASAVRNHSSYAEVPDALC